MASESRFSHIPTSSRIRCAFSRWLAFVRSIMAGKSLRLVRTTMMLSHTEI